MTIKELLFTLEQLGRKNDFIHIIKHYHNSEQKLTFFSDFQVIEYTLEDLNNFYEKEHKIIKIDLYYNKNQIDIHIK